MTTARITRTIHVRDSTLKISVPFTRMVLLWAADASRFEAFEAHLTGDPDLAHWWGA
ncbi:hypothetical protein [Mycobacterium basiliense]|uniref:hypothetical protein n=1 Tax=Mycobacterium basiliense TaxID=2094119 RepID=UPI001E2BCD53|nr:hypothetical protein [Mycobacterium basiliense]